MRECCEKYKNTHIDGNEINFCPICGNSFIGLATYRNETSILNQKDWWHITSRRLNINYDADFIREIIYPKCKVTSLLYKYKGVKLHGTEEDKLQQIASHCDDWSFISGYIRQK